MPTCAPSRPRPDCLTPPKGATSVEIAPVFRPTMPNSSASATARIASGSQYRNRRRGRKACHWQFRWPASPFRSGTAGPQVRRFPRGKQHVGRCATENDRTRHIAGRPACLRLCARILAPLANASLDMAVDLVDRRRVDHRADRDARLGAGPDLHRDDAAASLAAKAS